MSERMGRDKQQITIILKILRIVQAPKGVSGICELPRTTLTEAQVPLEVRELYAS